MSLLIESIKLLDGQFQNLFYHELRMNRSLEMLCGVEEPFDLEAFLKNFNPPSVGLFKCRITYDEQSREIEFIPYVARAISTLRIIEHDRISYEFKYADRKTIDKLFELRNGCDDVLIVKRGLVTDSSYCNIVFRRGNHWYTPWSALLKGTQRQKLIEREKITEEEITLEDIRTFETFKLINALVEFEGPEVPVEKIIR
jgi:4-amino-4-deoxychorismate lyase